MKRREGWLLLCLAAWLVSASGWGTECRFFRIECLDGAAPENLAITSDDSGQTFLEFDTVEGNSYSIEATDSLSPPAWTDVWSLTGDGQRAAWLTTGGWSRTFGGTSGDGASSVQQTSDGGYIVAGSTGGYATSDVYLVKTDANGDKVWSRTFGGSDVDTAYSVQQTTDGGYIVAGWTDSFGAGSWDVYLIKTDANGDEVWSRTFGGSGLDYALSVQQTSDGGYIVAGETRSGAWGAYLIKTDANGVIGKTGWTRTLGGSGRERAYSVSQTTDGGYIVAGWRDSFGAGWNDVYLVKTDQSGHEVWSRTFGGSVSDSASSVQQTSDGGYVVAGWTDSFGAGGRDGYLIETDADGKEIWSRTFGGSERDSAYSVQQTFDGGYVVAGYTGSFGAGSYDAYLIKTDRNGNELSSRTFGGSVSDSASSVQQTSDGGYIVAGSTGGDVYLIKTDQNGNAPPLGPTGVTVWGDDFEEHTPLYGAIGAPWTVISGSNDPIPGDPADYGTWRLWNTQGDRLANEDPAIDAMTGNYAIADSDLDPSPLLNEELITPDIDCTNQRQVRLDFNMNYRAYAEDADHEQIAEVDIRTSDDGLTWGHWTNLLRWDRTTVADVESGPQQVNLSAIADRKHIQIRFHFYDAKYDYWFAVDDVRVSGTPLPE